MDAIDRSAEPELSIVVPALNEAASLAAVIYDHRNVANTLGVRYEMLVLDDGSTDATGEILAKLVEEGLALRVLRHERSLGVGRSLLDLYGAARGRWLFFNAADGQIPASELRILWNAREGHALVMGWRRVRRDPPHRVVMSRLYSLAIRVIFGAHAHDVDSVRLYRSDALREAWPSTTSSFAEAEILINLLSRGHRVTEVVIHHEPRRTGRAHGGRFGTVSRALLDFGRFAVVRACRVRNSSH